MRRRVSGSITVALAMALAAFLSTPVYAGGVPGAIFTTTVNGSAVNANIYDSKCAVYLDGGPGPKAPARAAGLPDGDYYFQVTDPSGAQLLSTDPVSNRRFTVSGGFITAYTGTGGAAHATGTDQDHAAQGAITISLANSTCPSDFLNTPNGGNVYKVWATPVASFSGNPANVDNPCGSGCFHGFLPSQSKTDNFKAQSGAAATFCLTMQKQFDQILNPPPASGWIFLVTDPQGVTNTYTADSTGQFTVCQLGAGTYSVTEDIDQNEPTPPGCFLTGRQATLNGQLSSIPVTFTWSAGQSNMTVLFVNSLSCEV